MVNRCKWSWGCDYYFRANEDIFVFIFCFLLCVWRRRRSGRGFQGEGRRWQNHLLFLQHPPHHSYTAAAATSQQLCGPGATLSKRTPSARLECSVWRRLQVFFSKNFFLPVCYFLKCFIYYNAPYLQQFFFLFFPFFFLSLFLTCFSAYTIPRLSARILSLLALSRADVSARACQRCCDSGSCLGRAGMLTLLQLTSVIADENK